MSDLIFEQTGGIGLLHLSGEWGSEGVEKLRQGFMVSFRSADHVVVDLRDVTGLDAGCFRLFCSAYRVFTSSSKRLLLVGLSPRVFSANDAADRPQQGSHCDALCLNGCLWGWSRQDSGEDSHGRHHADGPHPDILHTPWVNTSWRGQQ
ncbi:MAG: STAS domain-containing protein [Thermodesulfovibrionales bacterium]